MISGEMNCDLVAISSIFQDGENGRGRAQLCAQLRNLKDAILLPRSSQSLGQSLSFCSSPEG